MDAVVVLVCPLFAAEDVATAAVGLREADGIVTLTDRFEPAVDVVDARRRLWCCGRGAVGISRSPRGRSSVVESLSVRASLGAKDQVRAGDHLQDENGGSVEPVHDSFSVSWSIRGYSPVVITTPSPGT